MTNKSKLKNSEAKEITQTKWIVIFVIAIISLGVSATLWVHNWAETRQKEDLLSHTKIIARSIGANDINTLAGVPEDLENPQYQSLKKVMMDLKMTQSDVRFVYMMGLHNPSDKKFFFYIDSEEPGTDGYSAPGDIYNETDEIQLNAYRNAESVIEGPYTDSFGSWVSGFSPIIDLSTGKAVALVGIDISATHWRETIWEMELIPVLITLLFLTMVISVWVIISHQNKLDKMKSEFVSVASHQLRTPLTGIKWFVDLMLRGKAGEITSDQKDFLTQISDSNERMIKLVEDLLNVSRIEAGSTKFIITKKATDIVPILDSLATDLIGLAAKHKVKIVRAVNFPKTLSLNVDPEKIRQVFGNLLSNAVKYSHEGGTVTVAVNMSDKMAIFSIKDTGLGIPANQQGRVFEKFFRADNVQTKETDGTGLGLYVVKAIVEGHGGALRFESKENVGTTFYVSLPK